MLPISQSLLTCSARHPYLSFTVHFIDENWELRSYCLDTVTLFEDHTGQNLAEAAVDILENWELQRENLVCTITDNGSNFIAAFQTLEWPRISCFGHNLDLAVNKALNIERVQRAFEDVTLWLRSLIGVGRSIEIFGRSRLN